MAAVTGVGCAGGGGGAVALVVALARSLLFDTSHVGQQYHFDSAATFAQGSNPYRDAAPASDHVALV